MPKREGGGGSRGAERAERERERKGARRRLARSAAPLLLFYIINRVILFIALIGLLNVTSAAT